MGLGAVPLRHSCPSDTGSYICGDLGDYSECPGGGPDEPVPEVERDVSAPRPPTVTLPSSGVGGLVRFTVRAERGSRVVVTDEGGAVVVRVWATGSRQRVQFHAVSGEHVYTATATDRAGNESSAGDPVTVTADARRPVVGDVRVEPASPVDVSAMLMFATEPGIAYDLAVGSRHRHLKGVTTAADSVRFWLANGRYPLILTVTDAVGNKRTVNRSLVVAVRRPYLAVKRLSAVGVTPVILAVKAPERSTGVLRMAGRVAVPFRVGAGGRPRWRSNSVTAGIRCRGLR